MEPQLYAHDLMSLWATEQEMNKWLGNPHPSARGRVEFLGGVFHTQRAYIASFFEDMDALEKAMYELDLNIAGGLI